MAKQYPSLSKDAIECAAERIRNSSSFFINDHRGAVTPIEEIAEFDLGLRYDFENLQESLQLSDKRNTDGEQILGAMLFAQKQILIDESLDPIEHPNMEGRFRFTIAHEVAHWVLHRHLFKKQFDAFATLYDGGQDYLLRQETPNARLEWQADYFAACILMPRGEVERAWLHVMKSLRPFDYDICRHYLDVPYREDSWSNLGSVSSVLNKLEASKNLSYDKEYILGRISREMARSFHVSTQSMKIRLFELGWLK